MGMFTKDGILKDMQEAADRMGLDLEDLQEMIGEVIEDCLSKAKAILKEVEAKDAEKIRAIAHDIKGSTANYGINEPSKLALIIEKGADENPKEPAENLLKQLEELAALDLS